MYFLNLHQKGLRRGIKFRPCNKRRAPFIQPTLPAFHDQHFEVKINSRSAGFNFSLRGGRGPLVQLLVKIDQKMPLFANQERSNVVDGTAVKFSTYQRKATQVSCTRYYPMKAPNMRFCPTIPFIPGYKLTTLCKTPIIFT